MKVLLLGGTGSFGKSAAALFARENLITEIGLASRNLETTQRIAVEIGDKAHAICVDIKDISRLSSVANEFDIIVNAAGPTSEVQVPAIQAAIEAGVHYCDLGVTGKSAQRALQLDSQARARCVTAIISTGWFTIMNLMAVHAVGQLDETQQVSICMLADYTPGEYFSPEQSLARASEVGQVETSWDVIETAGEPVLTYRAGSWIRLEPLENPIDVLHPSRNKITAYLTDSPSILTLPDHLPGVQTVVCLLGMIPPQLMKLFIQKSKRIARGETDWRGAAFDFFKTAVEDKERWLISPPGYPRGWGMWVVAEGHKKERNVRYMCWPSMFLNWTSVPLIIVALRILRGEVSNYGVLPPEACFELRSFLDESTNYVRQEDLGKSLINENFDWLD